MVPIVPPVPKLPSAHQGKVTSVGTVEVALQVVLFAAQPR
jgi:hypothetical protein